MSRRTLSIVAGAGAALLLAGCATGVGGSTTPTPTASASQTVEAEVEVGAAWLDGGSMIALVLDGSSTCVPMADDVAYTDGVLQVSLLDPAVGTACTRDLVPRGIPIAVPAGVDSSTGLAIEVTGDGYRGTTELAGVAGLVPGGGLEAGQPSAGWAGGDAFALLTWGSSSCRPTVADAVVSEPGQIAVTFATPPADQVCTADFGARVTVVTVPDVTAGTPYEALLTGDGFTQTPVAIAGTP